LVAAMVLTAEFETQEVEMDRHVISADALRFAATNSPPETAGWL
jgi:hypothetical protein